MSTAVAVKERPILFSAPMVRALLAGTKTQTRRVMKRLPPAPSHGIIARIIDWCHYGTGWNWKDEHGNCSCRGVMCPYGLICDRLWVRETIAIESWTHEYGDTPPIPTDRPHKVIDHGEDWGKEWRWPHYRATDPTPELSCERDGCRTCEDGEPGPHWRPSIHMPRWASRILLEITDVRVQRLQDISEEDAFAEGLERMDPGKTGWNTATILLDGWHQNDRTAVALYQRLWESINGDGSWDANPLVWALTFKRVQP